MTSKWATPSTPDVTTAAAQPSVPLSEQYVVLLLYGKNSFGDKIYSYVKLNWTNLQKMKVAVFSGQGFNPSDFGEVLAAGRGEPSDDVRAEIASMYQIIDNRQQDSSTPIVQAPAEKKAWDEF
ncbi:MAG: hypothetical protein SFT92_03865 [Rickettsiales bacterium]|nr:hypothetical protein [Rickettsiales bacterium]